MNFTGGFFISDDRGNLLASRENIPISTIISHRKATEVFLVMAFTQKNPLPPGDYIVRYVITDEPSGKSFEIVKDVKIATL
jgi:hypothetical protein